MKASFSIRVLFGWIVTFGVVGQSQAGQASIAEQPEEPVVVQLASGRSLLAAVAPQTDGTRLWLRWRHGTISVLRPIHWDRVVRAEYEGQGLSADQFRRAIVRPEPLLSTREEPLAPRAGTFRLHSLRWPAPPMTKPEPSTSSRPAITTIEPGRAKTPPLQSLAIDAWVTNWDSDVEVDGVVVDVRPLDARGAIAPVHGTLEVTLIGWRTGRTRPTQPPIRLGRWTRSVRPSDFASPATEYRFPFRSVHPDFDLQWAPHATVHARLSVPGQGVFDATSSDVRIRPYSALRDHLQQTTGHRFYDVERTARSPR